MLCFHKMVIDTTKTLLQMLQDAFNVCLTLLWILDVIGLKIFKD